MSAFEDYYLVEVEKHLLRSAIGKEIEKAKELYVKGWHPRRTAELFLLKCEKDDCWEERNCFHYCKTHHKEICMSGDE